MAAARKARDPAIPPLEWAAAAFGLALVCSVLGTMLWLGVTRGEGPAEVSVRTEAVAPAARGYVVTIRAVNTGDTTAADVTVEGELRGAGGIAETSTMSFKYLAPHSERRGGLFFEKDPRQFKLELRAKGYETP
jgi:uncharacterized protein (TIGR02588 family)